MNIFGSYTVNGEEMRFIRCGVCGSAHCIPEVMYAHRKESGGYWRCPNGHSWGFSEGQKTKDEVRLERDRLKQKTAQLEEEIASAERERMKAERALTKHKKRAAAGICPCCNRTVAQMAQHMKTKHPDYNVVPLKAMKA